MASHATLFSFEIPLGPDEIAWANGVVAYLDEVGAGRVPDEADEFHAVLYNFAEHRYSFTAAVQFDGLWIVGDDTAQPEEVVPLIQAFLSRFQPDGAIGFEWANTCTRPVLDSFSGGAAFITATGAEFHHTSGWLAEQHSRHRTNRSGGDT